MNITKAIIPVAGWGTRRLPITKTIEKCMLPIGNRPVVDYVVQDCIKAGITEIFFVISKHNTQLQSYYEKNQELEDYLVRNNKTSLLPLIKPPTIKMHYIVQPDNKKYGTAIPVGLVVPYLDENESVVVLMGDDCIYHRDDASEVSRLITAAGNQSSMLGVNIPNEELSRYGVIKVNELNQFVEIVEKPQPENAPSNMINVSKYVFNYELLKAIEYYANNANPSGEYAITDPINNFIAAGGKLNVIEAEGQYLDSGTVEGWLKANQIVINSISA